MSSHPGSTIKDAIELSLFLKKEKIHPKQVQDFYPTPGTISTAMFYTELDPYTLEKVYVPKDPKDKAMQRAMLQYFLPQNKYLVLDALKKAGRTDLIGNTKNCLISAPKGYLNDNKQGNKQNKSKNQNKNKFAKYSRKKPKGKK